MPRKRTRTVSQDAIENKESSYKPEVPVKIKAMQQAVKQGYKCVMKQGILMFATVEEAKRNEIEEWLLTNFGQPEKAKGIKEPVNRIPFSYGFSNISQDLDKYQQVLSHQEEEEMESDDRELE